MVQRDSRCYHLSINALINTEQVISIFSHYCKHHDELVTRAMFEQNIFLKKQHHDFQSDILPLLVPQLNWNFEEAIHLVTKLYIEKRIGNPWKKTYDAKNS